MGNYDPSSYEGGAPSSSASAGVGYALQGAKAIKDYITKRKSGGERSSAPSPDKSGGSSPDAESYRMAIPSTYKRGGMVRKTGWAKVHKGETVKTASQTKKERKRKRGRGARR